MGPKSESSSPEHLVKYEIDMKKNDTERVCYRTCKRENQRKKEKEKQTNRQIEIQREKNKANNKKLCIFVKQKRKCILINIVCIHIYNLHVITQSAVRYSRDNMCFNLKTAPVVTYYFY